MLKDLTITTRGSLYDPRDFALDQHNRSGLPALVP